MTLEEQNEHANALMRIANIRHVQFAKQLIALCQQHVSIAADTSPQSQRHTILQACNAQLLHVAAALDSLPPQA